MPALGLCNVALAVAVALLIWAGFQWGWLRKSGQDFGRCDSGDLARNPVRVAYYSGQKLSGCGSIILARNPVGVAPEIWPGIWWGRLWRCGQEVMGGAEGRKCAAEDSGWDSG